MLQKFVEGRSVSWVVPLNKQIEDYPLFMDTTRIVEDAIREDVRRGYRPENGPRYAIELARMEEYVGYVAEYLNRENYFKFDTRNYRFFLGSVPVRKHKTYGA